MEAEWQENSMPRTHTQRKHQRDFLSLFFAFCVSATLTLRPWNYYFPTPHAAAIIEFFFYMAFRDT
jgi:hypothetical protein